MKVGDLITTYYEGYFTLDRIEKRYATEADVRHYPNAYKEVGEEYSPLYYFTQKYDKNGNDKKSKQKACDAIFCKPAEERLEEEILKVEKLKQILYESIQ